MTYDLALVGCGGMGLRHLYGLVELRKRFDSFRLVAVCDRDSEAAEYVAGVAAEELGSRPAAFTDFTDLLSDAGSLDAVDISTDTSSHHTLAEAAFRSGLHVMVEKPMGVTVRACHRMSAAASAAGKTLAVAENYRRDPLCRLAKAILDARAIGEPRFVLDINVGGGDALMHNTAWRARRARGGSYLLEQGVHNADLLLYYMGGVDRVFAETATFEPTVIRRGMAGSPNLEPFYRHRSDDIEADSDMIDADAVDTGFAVLRFSSGAVGQLTLSNASHSHSVSVGTVHGSRGSMILPPSRTGRGPVVMLDGRDQPIEGDGLLALVPDFRLDPITAAFFGGESPIASYNMPFDRIDRTLVAIEYEDFARAIGTGTRPEVDAEAGMAAVALSYSLMESGELGAPVALTDVLEGRAEEYQKPVNQANAL